jgi:SLA1 homology domain 1, SHD1
MASARIHRLSCETGRLPHVCICCGAPATAMRRQRFTRQPTWQILVLPVILPLMIVVGVVSGLRVKRLYNPLAGEPLDLSVPLCSAHQGRLKWSGYCLWGLLALLAVALIMLLSSFAGQTEIMGVAVVGLLVVAAALVGASMVLQYITPRMTDYTISYVDMTILAPEFVEALAKTSASNVPGYGEQAMGVPLAPGMSGGGPSLGQLAIVGGTAAVLLAGCCLLGIAAHGGSVAKRDRTFGWLDARAKERRQAEADQQKQDGGRPPARPVANLSPVMSKSPAQLPPSLAGAAPTPSVAADAPQATTPTSQSPASRRTWTDSTGKFKIEAEFVSLQDGAVTLRRADEQEVRLSLERLSEADQNIARELAGGAK